jgi:SAM-dependent methyltransferase
MKDTCNKEQTSCSITDTGCKTSNSTEHLGEYWCGKYTDVDYKTLGWYEEKSTPSLDLIQETNVDKDAVIFSVGAGSTTSIDSLLEMGYTNLIANDISSCALKNIKERIKERQDNVKFITDDLINPTLLNNMQKVDIWNDRAVMHFFTEEKDQDAYFELLNRKVKKNGFVILAVFNLDGATMCSGLPVKRYNTEMLQAKLGDNYKLLKDFNYNYKMPNGEIRKYVYTLFQRMS